MNITQQLSALETQASKKSSPRRVAFASLIGTMVEWYDFFIYGTASALVFNQIFFPNLDPVMGVLASFATFGVAFVARPIGAIVFGHFGDRLGRKRMLVLSLLIMGIGTVSIGLLPTFEQVGLLAPTLLVICRLAQGFAIGGEWGGAVLMAVEHAPKGKRAFYGSFPQMGNPLALVLATGIYIVLDTVLTDEQFLEWGWRVPFLLSVVMIVTGMWVRLNLMESPAFAAVKQKNTRSRVPIGEVLVKHWRSIVVGICVTAAPNVPYYIGNVYVLNYADSILNIDRQIVLMAVMVASIVAVICMPISAILADRYGRVRILVIGAIFLAAFAFPFFWLVDTANIGLIHIAMVLFAGIGWSFTYSVQAAYFSELFPTRVRYTGTSVAYHLGGLITSAPVPLVATALVAWAGTSTPLSFYVIIASLVAIIGVTTLGRNLSFAVDESDAKEPE